MKISNNNFSKFIVPNFLLIGAVSILILFSISKERILAQTWNLKVFVNNVDVTGLRNQEFKGCTVRFDEHGNVFIDAPGYKIKKIDSEPQEDTSPPPSTTIVKAQKKPSNKYYLVTEEKSGAKVWDKYSLIINGKEIRTFKSSDGTIMEEITDKFMQGSNYIVLKASKLENFPGSSKDYWYKIVVGQGHEENKKIVIDNILIQMTRYGNDVDPRTEATHYEAK